MICITEPAESLHPYALGVQHIDAHERAKPI
ncbi:hypothetical protein METHPM2_610007 [Pseudomonas sp. PM2]